MAVDTAVQPLPCTQADYKYFRTLHGDFGYLGDHKNEQSNYIYAFKQTAFRENIVDFWPTIETMCRALKIPLTVTLHDIECIFSGFDAESIAALYKNERYAGIARKKIIPMEEYRLLQVTKELFDTLLARLHRTFRQCPQSVIAPNIEPCNVKWQKVPIIDSPKIQKQQSDASAVAREKRPPKRPVETLSRADSDILQAMSANAKTSMLRIEIECAAGYGKDAVTNSLKRLETMSLVCRPDGARRKGWALTEKGDTIAKGLRSN